MTRYGLESETIDLICNCFTKYEQIEKVLLYGSRAKGTFKSNSDIDLTIMESGLSASDFTKLENELDDILLPQKIDLSLFKMIKNPALIEHIQRVGIVIYSA